MTPAAAAAIERCDREIAGMQGQQDAPAWLVALGQNDWRVERALIEQEMSEGGTE